MSRVLALSLSLALASACSDGARETVTVVVEADRARALADQAQLAQMRAALDGAREELVQARTDLTALRERMVAAGALTADEARRLQERERALATREGALPKPTPSPATGAGLSRDEVEQLLRAQEERLALLVARAPSTPTVAAVAAPSAGNAPSRDDVEAAVAEARRALERRTLHVSDLSRGRELQATTEAHLKAGRLGDALSSARALAADAAALRVDLAFVKEKYARASATLSRLDGPRRQKAQSLLGEANDRVAAGDAAGASSKLTAVLLLAE